MRAAPFRSWTTGMATAKTEEQASGEVQEKDGPLLDLNQATDLAYLVPGVGVSNSAGPRSFGFFIRGVGTTSFASESIESSSAYVVDGVVTGQAGAALSDLPDIERIEVLRGPQGTLFGRNTTGGAVNVITKKPGTAFASMFELGYGEFDRQTARARSTCPSRPPCSASSPASISSRTVSCAAR
ncbi:MAG: TonB-dependent receptor plug domain-containing protein [Gammaproteobacteria bacterium]|nr:TonB-dependent receptor plug domain-containing protein [Gammaproteobacteria bacterium]